MVRNQLHLGEVCVCVLVARTTFKKGRSLFPGLILSRAGTRGRQDLRLSGDQTSSSDFLTAFPFLSTCLVCTHCRI